MPQTPEEMAAAVLDALKVLAASTKTRLRFDAPQALTTAQQDAIRGSIAAPDVASVAAKVGKGDLVIRVEDYLVGSGPAADTAAWKAAMAAAKAAARTVGSYSRGLPRIYAGSREWRLTESIVIRSIQWLTIEGTASIRVDSGIPAFEIHRSQHITIEGLTLTCGSADTSAATDGLIENSAGVWMHENSTDVGIPGNTTAIRFSRCRFFGFHRAVQITGNQMCDNIMYDQCRFQDNFIDLEVINGQAVNQRFLGGECDAWLNNTEAAYNARLALWSAAAVPATAKPNQFRDPALTTGPQQNVTVRDGAVFRILVGGEIHCDSKFSIVVLKTWLLFAAVPSDAGTRYGVNTNALIYMFEGMTGEIRITDTLLDSNGYQRHTLTRFELPHSTDANLVRVSPTIIFRGCRFSIKEAGLDLFHMAGPVVIRWHDSRLVGVTAAGNIRLCHTTSVTYSIPGDFEGLRATLLTPVITAASSAGAPAALPVVGTYNVVQKGWAGSGVMAYDNTNPYVSRSRLRQNNRPVEPVMYQFSATDGSVLGSTLNVVGQVKTIQLGPGAVIRRVGIVLSSVTSGTPTDVVLRFRDSANTVTYVDLTARWGTTATASESVGPFGRIFDGHRRPWAEVHDFAPSDGKVCVEVITKTNAAIVGFAWVEAY